MLSNSAIHDSAIAIETPSSGQIRNDMAENIKIDDPRSLNQPPSSMRLIPLNFDLRIVAVIRDLDANLPAVLRVKWVAENDTFLSLLRIIEY